MSGFFFMDISELHQIFLGSKGVSTDTRSLAKDQLYFALKGPSFDGNQYCQQALDKGASHCIIDDPQAQVESKTILVEDALHSLQELALFHRKTLNIPLIAHTGSNGKTTTKELLVAALKEKYQVAYTKGNLNNHIGVPLSLLSIKASDEIAVIEMGANAQKEIAFLSSLSLPDVGFITNYGKAHLEGFGGVEGVIKGKSELFDYLRENSKKALVNLHDPLQMENSKGTAQITFGSIEQADYIIEVNPKDGTYISAQFSGLLIQSNLTGKYNFNNLSIAISLASFYGLSAEEIKRGIESYQPKNNRSQLDSGKNNELLRDYYNANPSSMQASLENFASLNVDAKPKWVILGDMFELGEYSQYEHQEIANTATSLGFEKVLLVGQAFHSVETTAPCFVSTPELLHYMKEETIKGKLILIKGSRGMQLEKAADLL
jgi:UDP-N-acetylmuramoyl-tripeptide--D-alanyl-D-alanine ligase